MSQEKLGILVMAYGTPRSLDEVNTYYTHIRHGHAPTPELLKELTDRYKAIGGVSPLNEITMAEAEGLEKALNADGGQTCKVYLGFKHTYPFIADVVAQMHADGITHAVTLVLAPHYSTMSVAAYQAVAKQAAEKAGGPNLIHIDSWHMHQGFLGLLAQRVAHALEEFDSADDVMVVFSAHALPKRILAVQDPYPEQLHETGNAVAKMLKLPHHMFGWQSAGRTEEEWLGPDILDILRQLNNEGFRKVVICSAGFVSDHLEVLYDVDIEAQALAHSLDMKLVRTQSLNADPAFLSVLAQVVRSRLTHAASL